MQIIDVVPLTKGGPKAPVSYFTSKHANPGDVAKIPLRSRETLGLIIAVRELADAKAEVKGAGFTFKRALDVIPNKALDTGFVRTVARVAAHYASDLGTTLVALVPRAILEDPTLAGAEAKPRKKKAPAVVAEAPVTEATEITEAVEAVEKQDDAEMTKVAEVADAAEEIATQAPNETDRAARPRPQVLAVQLPDNDRYSYYKSLVREALARGSSVFFLVPSSHEASILEVELGKGVERFVTTLTGTLAKGELLRRWKAAIDAPHPIVVIGTGPFLSLPRTDIGVFVIENDLSGAYRMQTRPYLDIRSVAEELASERGASCLYGGPLLRIATLKRVAEGKIDEAAPLANRVLASSTCTVLPMKGIEQAESPILHADVVERIRGARTRNERVFLFCSRRGSSPLVVCRDCRETVTCTECGSPAALHKTSRGPELVCHRCGARRGADVTCKNCSSWNLRPIGIGVDGVVEEIQRLAPDAHVLALSSDAATTRKQAEKVVEKFYASGGTILVGTELALPYLRSDVEHAAVVSVDALLSIPDFLIHERIMGILLAMRRMATHTCAYQTRLPANPLFKHACHGNLADYTREEMKEREETGAPPYTLVITLTAAGDPKAIAEEMRTIAERFKNIENISSAVFPAFIPAKNGKKAIACMLTLPRTAWPHPEVIEQLRCLPQYVRIIVDAENVM